MEDSLANNLVNLVLPFGQVSGQRIILDGGTGEIRIYSAAGNLILQLDGAAGLRLFQDIVGGGLVGAIQPDNIFLVDPAVPDNFQVLPTGAGIDALIAGRSIPRGVLGLKKSTTDSGTTATEVKDTTLGDYALTAKSGRRYRVMLMTRYGSSVATDTAEARLRDGGASSPTTASTQLIGYVQDNAGAAGTTQKSKAIEVYFDCPADLSVGVHTLAWFVARASGSGNCLFPGSATAPKFFSVEDVGQNTNA